jgi:hypothetical protein
LAKKAKRKSATAPAVGMPIPLQAGLLDMGRKIALTVKKQSAEEIVYTLSDGTKLKLKPILVSIERSLNVFTPVGDPLYQIQTGIFMQTEVPKKLKKKTP